MTETPAHPSRARRPGRRATAAIVPLLLIAALAGLLAVQASSTPVIPHAPPAPIALRVAPRNIALGVTTTPLARNWWRPWGRNDLNSVSRFEHAVGAHARIVMWYADWQHNGPSAAQLAAVTARGSIPEITWEPWDASKGLHHPQPRYRLGNIIAGRFDRYIHRWARTLAASGRPVLLRFAQEMDGNWYPWDEHANGNRPGEFTRAWRHVHDIVTAAGATNVKWIWSPAFGGHTGLFPGSRYVDMLGLTCLNPGKTRQGGHWRSFTTICTRPIGELHALTPGLPIQLSEVGTSAAGGNQAAWIAGMFAFLRAHPEVSSLVWFNVRKTAYRVLEGSRPAQRAFALGLRGGVRTARTA